MIGTKTSGNVEKNNKAIGKNEIGNRKNAPMICTDTSGNTEKDNKDIVKNELGNNTIGKTPIGKTWQQIGKTPNVNTQIGDRECKHLGQKLALTTQKLGYPLSKSMRITCSTVRTRTLT